MKKQFQSKAVPRGTRTIWRYLGALILLFSLSIGQMWAGNLEYFKTIEASSTKNSFALPDISAATSAGGVGTFTMATGTSSAAKYYAKLIPNNADNLKLQLFNGIAEDFEDTIYLCVTVDADTYLSFCRGSNASYSVIGKKNNSTNAFAYETNEAMAKETGSYEFKSGYTYYIKSSTTTGNSVSEVRVYHKDASKTVTVTACLVEGHPAASGGGSSCTAPTEPAISGTAAYAEGDNISLTASATGATSATFTWYKGTSWADASASSSVGTGATLAINNCATSDAGTYWCNISNGSGCEVQVSKAITVSASSDPVPVSSVSVTAPVDGHTYYVGEQVTLAATVLPDNATNKTLNWTMDVSDKATIADGKITFTEAGDFHLTASATDGSGKSNKVHLYVSNPTLITSIALDYDEQHITVGDVITITPTILPANATNKNLLWSVTDGATITQEGVLTAVAQSDVIVTAAAQDGSDVEGTSHIFIDALPACATLNPATSGSSPTAKNQEIILQTEDPNESYGGKIYTAGAKDNNYSASFTYTANGIQLGKGGADSMRVELNHLMKVGTVITVNMNWTRTDGKASGLILQASDKSTVKSMTKVDPSGAFSDSYTVQSTDTKLIGKNSFLLARSNSIALTSLQVSNCGAELYALNSAIDPVAAEGKATITLSKNLVAAGGTATATYSAIDAAYDFDEWVINGATIDNAKANPVTITMGSEPATITLKLKAASVKHTVTYYDENDNNLGEELVVEGQHPVGLSIAPRKLGYTFAGWGTSKAGPVVAFSDVTVNADMPLYTIWNEIDCSTLSGTIYTMSITVAPAANCTITSTTGTHDLYQYEGVTGGEAILGNKGTSNNCILQTNKTILLKDDNSYIKLDFDCPLKEGDKIVYSVGSNNPVLSTGNSKPSTPLATLDRSKTEFVIPAESGLIDAQTVYVWKGGGNTTVTYINIVRPAKYAVTFNMQGHGTQVETQNIVSGGKVEEPATTDITDWDFGGWFTNAACSEGKEWAFATATVSQDTVLYAKWTEHVASSDATLSSLSYTIGGGDPIAIPLVTDQYAYAVELPMGTDIDAPVIAAEANDPNVKEVEIVQTNLGVATVTVTAEDNSTIQSYAITFSVATSKDIELVWDKSKERCDATKPDANVLIAAMSEYLSASYTGSAAEGGSLNTGKTTGSKIIITAKPGYAFKAMGFYGKIEDGTCNFYNDGVVETVGTSTGDACYANVFSNDEVHEFVIELTGSNGVYIRNMQLTIIEACTPIVVAWDEEPVEFEVGKAGYAIAATANNGGTIAYSSTDGDVIAVNGSTGALTVSALGSVTLKAATAEGDGTTYCANGGNNIEISKMVNTYYLVKFDAHNGDEATEVKYYASSTEIALPAAPSYPGYNFQGWFDAETGGNQYVENITPTASITVHAQWQAQCPGATITTQPTGASYLTGRTPAALVCEATAGNNGTLIYEWFTCDDEQKTNPVAATATPSTAVAGTFYYFCKVMEAGCDLEAYSEVVTITVADKDPIYLAWVNVTGQNAASLDASKSLYAPEVSATGIKNSSSYGGKTGWKFNSAPGYIAIEGAPFKSGDIVEMFVTTTTADKARVFNANEAVAANVVAEGAANMVQGANKVALTADANNLYLRRGDDFGGWNPYVAYVAVYRECAPILNKVTVAGVEAAPDAQNKVAIEVPASTADVALEAIAYDWVSNNADWTAAHAPAVANAWEWGVENTLTFADQDGDESVYYVTISKAAASSDATLSALTVNGQAIALEDGVFEYSFELPYGTSAAPTVVATANHVAAVTTVDPCTLSGATITVVPESGEADKQVYTLTFTVSAWKEVVIWDGSNMTAVAASPDATTGFAWTVNGFSSITNYNATCGTKAYTKTLPSGGGASASRNVAFTVPAGYVAKFYIAFGTHSDGNNRGMFIGTTATKTLDETSVLTLYSDSRTNLTDGTSEIVGAGTYYLNPMESEDFYEIRAYVRKGMVRNQMLGNGVLGTSCVDHNVAIEDIQGATFYELMGREPQYGKLAFDEIVSGELEAGVPYLFQAHGDKLVLFYGETKVDEPVDKDNGMYGTFVAQTLTELDGIYYFAQRALWSCVDLTSLSLPANRAYVKLSEIDYMSDPTPAPGRRRVLMNVNGEKNATGFENIEASEKPMKLMINGQIFILRGEKMFDATGRLVK